MRRRFLPLGLGATVLGLTLAGALPTPARAATSATCFERATVSVGVPDLFSSLPIANPVTLNVPIIGTPDLFTGPSCSMQVEGSPSMTARIIVGSTAGLVAGKMTVSVSSAGGFFEQTINCGPALTTCEASGGIFASSSPVFVSVRCSVSGVLGASTTVGCSVQPTI